MGIVLRLAIVTSAMLCVRLALAGDCKIQSINGQSVQLCDNGYVETTGRSGRTRSFGIRNGGVERYPGNTAPSWALERRR